MKPSTSNIPSTFAEATTLLPIKSTTVIAAATATAELSPPLSAWNITVGVLTFGLATITVAGNLLTLLALRQKYGLPKILESTTIMIRALSCTDLLNGLCGVSLVAIHRLFRRYFWFDTNSTWAKIYCSYLVFVWPDLQRITSWYLVSFALCRLLLVVCPQRARRWLARTGVQVLLVMVPILLGTINYIVDRAFYLTTVVFKSSTCLVVPVAAAPSPQMLVTMRRLSLMTLLMGSVIPYSIGFVLYVTMFVYIWWKRAHATTTAATATIRVTNSAAAAGTARALRLLAALAIIFVAHAVFTTALYTTYLLGWYSTNFTRADTTAMVVSDVITLLYIMAIASNALILTLTSKDFREVYKKILQCK